MDAFLGRILRNSRVFYLAIKLEIGNCYEACVEGGFNARELLEYLRFMLLTPGVDIENEGVKNYLLLGSYHFLGSSFFSV